MKGLLYVAVLKGVNHLSMSRPLCWSFSIVKQLELWSGCFGSYCRNLLGFTTLQTYSWQLKTVYCKLHMLMKMVSCNLQNVKPSWYMTVNVKLTLCSTALDHQISTRGYICILKISSQPDALFLKILLLFTVIENNANCSFEWYHNLWLKKARAHSGDQTQCLLIASWVP